MKKVNLDQQLELAKEVISNLTEEQLQEIEGGQEADSDWSCIIGSCNTGTTRTRVDGEEAS